MRARSRLADKSVHAARPAQQRPPTRAHAPPAVLCRPQQAALKAKEAWQAKLGVIETEIAPLARYTAAEAMHQSYLAKGGRFGKPQSPAKSCADPIRCYG